MDILKNSFPNNWLFWLFMIIGILLNIRIWFCWRFGKSKIWYLCSRICVKLYWITVVLICKIYTITMMLRCKIYTYWLVENEVLTLKIIFHITNQTKWLFVKKKKTIYKGLLLISRKGSKMACLCAKTKNFKNQMTYVEDKSVILLL